MGGHGVSRKRRLTAVGYPAVYAQGRQLAFEERGLDFEMKVEAAVPRAVTDVENLEHQDVIILQIQQWLEEHFADKFRFEDVAREHGMSIRNFMRRFQTATGDKPLHYLQRLRIETAKGLLSGSRKSIKTISYEVGYDDASFFARLFRQHTDLSPNQYRQQFQQAA